jgi:thermitase
MSTGNTSRQQRRRLFAAPHSLRAMTALGKRLGRAGRLSAATALLLAGLLPASVSAQSIGGAPTPAPPPISKGSPDDVYPHVDSMSLTGKPTRAVKTTKTSVGVEALADRILLSVQRGLSVADLAMINQKAAGLGAGAATPVLTLRNGSYLVDVSGASSVEAAAKAYLAADTRVVAASPDAVVKQTEVTNDPLAPLQSNLDRIQAHQAWNRAHGDFVKVAVLDTGISEGHPDLAGKVDDRTNVLWFSSGGGDDNGHGTHVAGIIAATPNNNEGIVGVGFNTHLLNVKVLYDSGKGTVSGAATGVYWAVDHGADVINMSLGGDRDCSGWWIENWTDTGVAYLRDAINYAYAHNVVVVAAAGNSGNTAKEWPAACNHVLAVANTDNNDNLNDSSTRGTWVQVAAPGTNILSSTVPGGTACQSGQGDFGRCTGTSMSSPHVAAVAALVRSSCGPIGAQAIMDRITDTADPIAGTGTNFQFGRINALRAVCLTPPSGLRVTTVTDSTLGFVWGDAGVVTQYKFSYRLSNTANTPTDVILPGNTVQYTVSGLQPNVSYDFWVAACDAGECSAPSNVVHARTNFFRLTTTIGGYGKVISHPAGINCAISNPPLTSCSAFFQVNSQVTLGALGLVDWHTHDEYDFDHWEGACSGTDSCVVTMNQAQNVRAVFKKVGNSGG